MHVDDAIDKTLGAFGVSAMAEQLAMSAQILRNKANPGCTTNHLTLRETIAIMRHSGDISILEALAEAFGCTLVRNDAPTEHASLIAMTMQRSILEGKFAAAVHEAIEDGVITPNEMSRINGAGLDLKRMLGTMLSALANQVPPAPKAHA